MERIAVISDIHANIHALNVFMNYINTECKVSKILNLGDFIQIGPNPTEVFDIVMNDKRYVNILGNSEYMFFDKNIMKLYENEFAHQEWVKNQLGSDRIKRLEQVPLIKTVEIQNKQFLMVHSRINSVVDKPLLYADKPLTDFIADYNTEADYVLIGHTHLPLYAVHWNCKPIINPGSIGCGKDGIVRFAIIEILDGLVNVTYKQLKYNKEKTILDYKEKNVPYGEKFIAMFY